MDMVFSHYFRIFSHSILFILLFFTSSATAQEGLLNSGFEQGEAYWNIVSEADSVSVVEMEDGDDSPTYADLNITVNPDKGAKMLRLGAPKQVSENMNVGGNTVSQTFNSNNEAVVLSFRLFSWEHRERDTFTIDVKQVSDPTKKFTVQDRNGGNLSVTMFTGETTQTCSVTPCVLQVYGGKQGDFVNTGWQRVIVSGLPTDGSEVTISYSLDGVNDEGHPSWAYVDSWNNDPVANFTVSRQTTIEGNVSRFTDTSTDADPGDKITKRVWEITYFNASGVSQTETKYDAREIAVVASNQGTVSAKLKVFDRFGGSDEIQSGQSGPDGIVPDITYQDGPILANNLTTYNVVAGSKGNILTARYAKPGWDDQVNATWIIGNGSGTLVQSEAQNTQYNVPMMLKGVASIPFDAPDEAGTTIINLTLSDPVGGKSVSRNITVNILPVSVFSLGQDDDGNDTPTTATLIQSGQVNVAHLNKQGDIDYYKVTDANGNNFPVGSEIFVRLRNVSTDHDLFVLSKLPAGSENAYDEFNNDLKDLWSFSGDASRLWSFSGDASRLWGFSGDASRLWAFSGDASRLWGFSGDASRLWGFSGDASRLWAFSGDTSRLWTFSGDTSRLWGFSGDASRLWSFSGDASRLWSFSGDASRLWAFSGDASRLDNPEGINSVDSVIFSTPPATGLSWQEAIDKSVLHSMWLRDSELEPFSASSINKGFGFSQIPLSEALFLPQYGSSVGNKDIDISETSLNEAIENGYKVLSFSANDGYNDELVILRVNTDQDIYLAVASDGEFGSPYSLQVENSFQTELENITDGACIGEYLVDPQSSGTNGIIADANFGDEVMYVVNPQRMAAKYGQARWDAVFSRLKILASMESGKILAIHHADKYATMDTSPCVVGNANAVAAAIRGTIASHRGSAKSVVLVGDDDIIPYYRAVDPTDFNERDYIGLTPARVSSPLYSAMFHSNILTDKYYASDYSVENMPFKILVPEWPVSRLVETPEDIIASIDEHVSNEFGINMQTAMVSAYDVVLDSGKEISSILSNTLTQGGFDNVTEVPLSFDLSSPWYAADIRCHMLGDESLPGCTAND
ncbi:MAG: hypothetical protein PVJ63_12190, partial [Thioalkalispiraceae bacterium]